MTKSPALFKPLQIRGVTLPNRVVLSPLCMYSCTNRDGVATDFHFAHLSTFARGKVGLVFTEATAVEPRGRITPLCLGLWNDEQAEALRPIVNFIRSQGCVAGMQLAHAGRKASAHPPFHKTTPGKPLSGPEDGAWQAVAPSAVPADAVWPTPQELDEAGVAEVRDHFVAAAKRAVAVGFQVVELHYAHGYLVNTFLSPLSNFRTDKYGGSLENRMRFALETAEAVRAAIPDDVALFARISAIDGVEGGWTLDDSIALARELKARGVDVVDCSSGGVTGPPRFRVTDDGKPLTKDSARGRGFQVPLAEGVRRGADVATMAVGVIVDPHQAEEIVASGKADLVALGRALMYEPFWTLHAAEALECDPNCDMWPDQYGWAVRRRKEIMEINAKSGERKD